MNAAGKSNTSPSTSSARSNQTPSTPTGNSRNSFAQFHVVITSAEQIGPSSNLPSVSAVSANHVPEKTKIELANILETHGKCCSQYIELSVEDSDLFSTATNLIKNDLLKRTYNIPNNKLSYPLQEKIFNYNYRGLLNTPAKTQAIVRLINSEGKLHYLLLKQCGATIEIHTAQPNIHDFITKETSLLINGTNPTPLIPLHILTQWFPHYALSENETATLVAKINEIARSCPEFSKLLPQNSSKYRLRNTTNEIITTALKCISAEIKLPIKPEVRYDYTSESDSDQEQEYIESDSYGEPESKILSNTTTNRKRRASDTPGIHPHMKRQRSITEENFYDQCKSLCTHFLSEDSKVVIRLHSKTPNKPGEDTSKIEISTKKIALMIVKTVLNKWENEYTNGLSYSIYFSQIKQFFEIYTPNNTRAHLQEKVCKIFNDLYNTFECPLIKLEECNLSNLKFNHIQENIITRIPNDSSWSTLQIGQSDLKNIFQGKQQIILKIAEPEAEIFMYINKDGDIKCRKINYELVRPTVPEDKLYIFKIYKKILGNFADPVSKEIFNELKIRFLELYTTILPHLNRIDKKQLETDYKIMVNMHTTLKTEIDFKQISESLIKINQLFKPYLTDNSNNDHLITPFNTIRVPKEWLNHPEQLTALDDIISKDPTTLIPTKETLAIINILGKHCTHEFLADTIKPEKLRALMQNISWKDPSISKNYLSYILGLLDAYHSNMVKNYGEQTLSEIEKLLQPYVNAIETLIEILVSFDTTPKLITTSNNTPEMSNVILYSGIFYTFQEITEIEFNKIDFSKVATHPNIIYVVPTPKYYTINSQMKITQMFFHPSQPINPVPNNPSNSNAISSANIQDRPNSNVNRLTENEWNKKKNDNTLTPGRYIIYGPRSYYHMPSGEALLKIIPIEEQQQSLNQLHNKEVLYNKMGDLFSNWKPKEPTFQLKRDNEFKTLTLKQSLSDQDIELLSAAISTNGASKEVLNIFENYSSPRLHTYLTKILDISSDIQANRLKTTSFTILFILLLDNLNKNKEFHNSYKLYIYLEHLFLGTGILSFTNHKIILDIITELLLSITSSLHLTKLLDHDSSGLIRLETLNKLKTYYTTKIKDKIRLDKYIKLLEIVDEKLIGRAPLRLTHFSPENTTQEEAPMPLEDGHIVIPPDTPMDVDMTETPLVTFDHIIMADNSIDLQLAENEIRKNSQDLRILARMKLFFKDRIIIEPAHSEKIDNLIGLIESFEIWLKAIPHDSLNATPTQKIRNRVPNVSVIPN
ncbi:MAG: hypothetical protein KBD37_03305 [Burkholderiales bacterium]|nr:hypothetical protein [Burkholderiales bacterium]